MQIHIWHTACPCGLPHSALEAKHAVRMTKEHMTSPLKQFAFGFGRILSDNLGIDRRFPITFRQERHAWRVEPYHPAVENDYL